MTLLGCLACAQAETPTTSAAADTTWVASSALYEVFVQDFSPEGTLHGVIAGLDRIQQSGANVIWLMPLHPRGIEGRKGSLGSPYASRDYRAIDSAFGTAADLKALVDSAHGRGLKVIIDFVPNHTAVDHVWTREKPDFYVRDSAGRVITPINNEGKPTDWTDVAELDYGNPALRTAMIETMTWWLREFNLDGFRVDVAGFVPYDFWREAVPALRAAVPRRILLLAEWGDAEMHRVGYDLSYGWSSYGKLKAVWDSAAASSFTAQVRADLDSLPAGAERLRFTTNHDETAWDAPPVARFKSPAGARAAFVAMALLPGTPLLYNGQEVESPQKLGIFEKEAVAWAQPAADSARDFYADVLALARTHPSILGSEFTAVETTVPARVIAYRRNGVLVLVNARDREARFRVTGFDVKGARSLLGSGPFTSDDITLPGYGYAVLER
jgi:glycosidase